jgi:hypothetical protein
VVGAARDVGDLLAKNPGEVFDELGGGLNLRISLLQLTVAKNAEVGVAPRVQLARLCRGSAA